MYLHVGTKKLACLGGRSIKKAIGLVARWVQAALKQVKNSHAVRGRSQAQERGLSFHSTHNNKVSTLFFSPLPF